MNILISGGRVIDPAQSLNQITDLYISQGEICAIGTAPEGFHADEVIDADGQIVCPGLIDLCTTLREPGQTRKGTIASETAAAAAGGITTLVATPDSSRVVETAAVAELIQERAGDLGFARVRGMGALRRGLGGEQVGTRAGVAGAG